MINQTSIREEFIMTLARYNDEFCTYVENIVGKMINNALACSPGKGDIRVVCIEFCNPDLMSLLLHMYGLITISQHEEEKSFSQSV